MLRFLTVVLLTAMLTAPAAAISLVTFQEHNINITIDPQSHMASVHDEAKVVLSEDWSAFVVNEHAKISEVTVDGEPILFDTMRVYDTQMVNKSLALILQDFVADSPVQVVVFDTDSPGEHVMTVSFQAEFFEDVSNTRFSNENVGREISGTIFEQGAYLSPSAYYYPQGAESTARFRLMADIPAEWESVSDGNPVTSEIVGDRKQQSWASPFESDGLMFFAAPFVTQSTEVEGINVACYFFEEDTSLIAEYLEASARYIIMYTELIGPYPFEQFTVAENFFPTGYGMPGWTLLGQQVIRLPFIKHTSLGHEVLHNWWGNGVFVDYERGNWCEATTVYGADYRYKLMQSEAAATAYRKDILKQYVSYVDEGSDFPIREFISRTSPNTRTIGYNKAMMVLHMIESEIGTEPFFAAWRLVYEKHVGQKIGWEEWIAAFEQTSGKSLSHVLPEWIDRTGAIELAVERSAESPAAFTLKQTGDQVYTVLVPIRFNGPDMQHDTTVLLDGPEMEYTLPIPDGAVSLTVDPDYNLFRRLYPEEVEPIVASIMGWEDKRFINAGRFGTDLFAEFGENMSGGTVTVLDWASLVDSPADVCPIILNPDELPDYLAGMITMGDGTIGVGGTEYPQEGHTCVLSGQNWRGFERYLVILTDNYASLPRIGQLLPHYGKYSFLVFEGARNVGKGQWPVGNSPLAISLK